MPKKLPPFKYIVDPACLGDLPELVLEAEAFARAGRALLEQAILAGTAVPGADLIPTKPQRKWVDNLPEREIRRHLVRTLRAEGKPHSLDDVSPRSLVSVAEAERRVGSKPKFYREMSNYFELRSTGNVSLVLGNPTNPSDDQKGGR